MMHHDAPLSGPPLRAKTRLVYHVRTSGRWGGLRVGMPRQVINISAIAKLWRCSLRICVYIYIYIVDFPRSWSWWNRTHELWFIVSPMSHQCSPFPQFKNSFLVFKHFRALPMAYRTVWPFVQVWCFRGIWVREAPVTTCRGNTSLQGKTYINRRSLGVLKSIRLTSPKDLLILLDEVSSIFINAEFHQFWSFGIAWIPNSVRSCGMRTNFISCPNVAPAAKWMRCGSQGTTRLSCERNKAQETHWWKEKSRWL